MNLRKWIGPEEGLTDLQSAARILLAAELAAVTSIASFTTWPRVTMAVIALGVIFTTAWISGKYVLLPILAIIFGFPYDPDNTDRA